jgi:hypothetical protein
MNDDLDQDSINLISFIFIILVPKCLYIHLKILVHSHITSPNQHILSGFPPSYSPSSDSSRISRAVQWSKMLLARSELRIWVKEVKKE